MTCDWLGLQVAIGLFAHNAPIRVDRGYLLNFQAGYFAGSECHMIDRQSRGKAICLLRPSPNDNRGFTRLAVVNAQKGLDEYRFAILK